MKSVQLIASTVLLAAQVRAADSLFGFYPGKSSLVAYTVQTLADKSRINQQLTICPSHQL
jgi:hypothetical protein